MQKKLGKNRGVFLSNNKMLLGFPRKNPTRPPMALRFAKYILKTLSPQDHFVNSRFRWTHCKGDGSTHLLVNLLFSLCFVYFPQSRVFSNRFQFEKSLSILVSCQLICFNWFTLSLFVNISFNLCCKTFYLSWVWLFVETEST